MTVYLTFNDAPSGVYASQVIDSVYFLSEQTEEKVRLVAFVSLRDFEKSKQKIRAQCPTAIVVPMFPGVKNWKWNHLTLTALFLFLRPNRVMARGVFATHLAHQTRKGLRSFKLIFDARGAYYPEFKEYRIVDDEALIGQVKSLEAAALKNSNAQLAVSHALIDYWREDYDFDASKTAAVIPCTLSTGHNNSLISTEERTALRAEYGIQPHHALLVYSGSAAGWQSIDELLNWLARLMQEQPHLRLLLLTPLESLSGTPLKSFADRVLLRWVSPDEVQKFLSMGDYGLLLRSASTTNQVASPTKFAEYLAAGLHVLISPGVGDFSEFTVDNHCGKLVSPNQFPDLPAITESDRTHAHSLAKMHFTKFRYTKAYQQLLGE